MTGQQQIKFGDLEPSKFPGERLGLPESGSGSVARLGRRVLAICVDWLIASVISMFFIPAPWTSLGTLGIFAVLQVLFITFIGGSAGHYMFGLRVITLSGQPAGFLKALARTLLLCIVVPVLVWDSDQRAFHDKIPGTVLVRV